MAGFPSNSGSTPNTPAHALDMIVGQAGYVKQITQSMKTRASANPVSTFDIISYAQQLADTRDAMTTLAATPGLAAYAQAQYGNSADIVALFNTMIAALDATRTWITTNFPKSAGGELLERKFDANARTTYDTFSVQTLTPFVTQLTALLATID